MQAAQPHITINSRNGISTLVLILFHFVTHAQINCANDSTGLVPIVDLLTGSYEGYTGGLYPGGTNEVPAAHLDSGIAIANAIMPLNFDAEEDTMYGKVVFLALGGGSAQKSFNRFYSDFLDAGYFDSCVRIVNACMEEYDLRDMFGPVADDTYWKEVNDFLQQADVKKRQVQAVWMMTPAYTDTFTSTSAFIDTLSLAYINAIREIKVQFPNAQLLFLTGSPYGGYTDSTSWQSAALMEPASYLTDFAIRQTIAAQISGDTLLTYYGEEPNAPWLAWGANIWADGKNARAYDGLRWMCPADYDAEENGYVLAGSGLTKVSTRLYDFFTTSPVTTPWIFGLPYDCFTEIDTVEDDGETIDTAIIPEGEILWITQNPVKGVLKFTINLETDDKAQVYVFDMLGNEISEGVFNKIEQGRVYSIKLTESARAIYVLSVFIENRVYNKLFYLDN